MNTKSNRIYEKYEDGFSIQDFELRADIVFYINEYCTQHIFEYKLDNEYDWHPRSSFILPRPDNAEEMIGDLYWISVKEGLV